MDKYDVLVNKISQLKSDLEQTLQNNPNDYAAAVQLKLCRQLLIKPDDYPTCRDNH